MRFARMLSLTRRLATLASSALLVAACQQSATVEAPAAASPSPVTDTRATATLLPTYTQPVFGAAKVSDEG